MNTIDKVKYSPDGNNPEEIIVKKNWRSLVPQFIKDIREEKTLNKKWKEIEKYAPTWVKLIDFKKYSNGCLLDIGSHYGLVSIYFIKQTGNKSYAFDINKNVNELVKKTLKKSNHKNYLQLMNIGLSNKKKIVNEYTHTKYSGGNSINQEQLKIANKIGITLIKGKKILVSSIDNIIITNKISLIKIDVEGEEANVIIGGLKTIQRDKPDIVFEALTKEKLDDCKKILDSINYETIQIDERNYIAKPRVTI